MTYDPENPLHTFARWTAETPAGWSPVARTRARDAFIDVIACMVPGAREEVTERIFRLARGWGSGSVHTVGYRDGLSAPFAALVGGTAAHALDFDDIFDPAKAHGTAALGPALLALGEAIDATGDRLIDAFIVGTEVIGRLGQAMLPFHRHRGWHSTATLGTVGTAAGCARLLGLDWQKSAHAISLSTSLAGGFMSQFGSMTKPLHAGLAARSGVEAALFAEAGITAGERTLDGKHGMQTLMVGTDLDALQERMKSVDEYGQTMDFRTLAIGEPLLIEAYGLKVKRFPACGSVTRALDALLDLRAAHGFTAAEVTDVFVRAPAWHMANLTFPRPKVPSEARFSLEYCLAVGLLTGNNGLQDFEPAALIRPEVTSLLPLIRREAVDKLESEFPTEVHVTLKDGRTLAGIVSDPVGSLKSPLSLDQLWGKFDACAEGHLDAATVATVKGMLARLDGPLSVRELNLLLAV